MSLKQVKYIQIDDEKGALYSAGKQSLLIPVTFIKALDLIFDQMVGRKGADILIYKMGESLGKEYVSTLEAILKKEKMEFSPEMKLRMTTNAISMEAGWGKVKILEMNLAQDLLKIELNYSPSGEFLKENRYNLERGIFAGIYKEIMKKEVYCQLLKENKKKHSVIFLVQKEIPKEIKAEEKLVLLTRKELEEKIEEAQEELKKRIEELEAFHKLTVGRELRMVELKKEIEKLKGQLEKQKYGGSENHQI